MKLFLTLLITLTFSFASTLPTQSVVKIYASVSFYDYKYPWQTAKVSKYTGSGAIIKDNQILTSAHVVSGARFIEVKKENDPKKYIAKIKYISHQSDLALLEVEDKSFFNETKALSINENVKHRDAVTVLGYPIGGNAISTTTGVISRIEYQNYVWSQEYLPAIQIDAAINSGNSGGPAVNAKGELVGIAMMKINNTSNIAYIVPSIIINTFLKDTKDGKVDGFYNDTTVISYIENEQLKQYYGLQNGNGVLVTYADLYEKDLKVDDIILSIDNKDIANNKTIESKFGRINFYLALHTKQIGDIVKLKVLRDKKVIDIDYTIKRETKLINTEFAKEPRYFIFGGLVFTPITKNYLKAIGHKDKAIDMLFYKDNKSEDFTEAVAWMQTIFPHNVNRGYYSTRNVVNKVNGIKIKSFKHFVDIVDSSQSKYIVIDFVEKIKVILNKDEARKSFEDLKKIYYLNTDRRVD